MTKTIDCGKCQSFLQVVSNHHFLASKVAEPLSEQGAEFDCRAVFGLIQDLCNKSIETL